MGRAIKESFIKTKFWSQVLLAHHPSFHQISSLAFWGHMSSQGDKQGEESEKQARAVWFK
eukprot:1157253-Pelagomonas_calceolata.AAC.5